MASDTDVEVPVVYLRWEADAFCDKSSSEKPLHSSEFRFQKHEWRLNFYLEKDGNKKFYHLGIRIPIGFAPFDYFVHVEDCETGRIQPQLSKKEKVFPCYVHHADVYENYRIWCKYEGDVKRWVEIERNYHKVRFLVVLKKEDVVTDCKEAETETVEQASCSTTSKSVQTSLLHSVSPCLESLSEDLAQLMVHQDSDPDMEFLCGGQSTRAHKSIVCSRSPVIARMMASDMVEGRTGVVTIPNMEPDVFRTFLGYLYSGKLEELSFDAALALYQIGSQYAVPSLVKRCLRHLMEHLSVENACEILAMADVHGDSKFAENVIEYILENKIPLVSDRWPGFCDDHPKLANKVLSHFYKTSINIEKN